MRRAAVIGWVALGALSVILMVTVAWNGTKLDEARQERDDLQFEVDDLRQEVETLTTERDELQRKADEHLKTIEQLKAGANRAPGTPTDAGASPSPASPATPSAPAPAKP